MHRFDDFADDARRAAPPRDRAVASYALRTLAVGAWLEAALRRAPVFALAASGAHASLGAADAAAFAFVFVNVLWLKFAFVWRLFRTWARAEGVDAPENMPRFVCDTSRRPRGRAERFETRALVGRRPRPARVVSATREAPIGDARRGLDPTRVSTGRPRRGRGVAATPSPRKIRAEAGGGGAATSRSTLPRAANAWGSPGERVRAGS